MRCCNEARGSFCVGVRKKGDAQVAVRWSRSSWEVVRCPKRRRFALRVREGEASHAEPHNLKILNIGDESFASVKAFSLSDASSLTSLALGRKTFSACTEFVIENPTSLATFHVGDSVAGNVLSLNLSSAHRLSQFAVGKDSFVAVTDFSINRASLLLSSP